MQGDQGGFVSRNIRRTNLNLMVTNGILVVALFLIWRANERYYENFFHGPFRLHGKALLTTKDPGSLRHYYVTISGEKSADLGLREVEVRRSRYASESDEKSSDGDSAA